MFLALMAGSLGSIQGAINSYVGKSSGQYVMIVGVSLVQVIISLIIVVSRGEAKMVSTGPALWMLVSGLLGVFLMFAVSFSIGSLGTLPVYVLLILGQVLFSACMNHFGWFGTPQSPITLQKLGSILIILFGVFCLVKSS
nr:DMT family transporter [Paenibacillus sp. SYP-B3998]